MAGEALLLDLPGLGPAFQGDPASFLPAASRLSSGRGRPSLLLVLCSPSDDDAAVTAAFKDPASAETPGFAPPCHVLRDDSVARLFYRAKVRVDELALARVTVRTGGHRRAALLGAYAAEMFTPVYHVEVDATGSGVPSEPSPAELAAVRADVEACFRGLPSITGPVRVLRSPLIPGERFLHGFSTRQGGVSHLPGMSSLNLSRSVRRRDPPGATVENKRRLAQAAGFALDSLRTPKVCHSTAVWVLGTEEPAEYDGLLTARPGVTLGAPGADCIPLLLADPVRGACGAVHSGWRGTVGGIGGVAVRAMVAELGCSARDLRVVLGPSIGPCCFQVGPEVAAQFSAIDATCLHHLADGTTNADLRKATRILLERSGVLPEHIDDGTLPGHRDVIVTLCTSCHPELFFSYRRDGSEFGTMLGFIALRE
ncbi:purine nucleoside phosphorylase LACC1 [Lethenteron reissneri]|uniref:purine nucleoside phosphorylase LACC1 n=1 Tax=Lethenteron reissneri TaxID=7753 RepID=UPI002AB738A5|nr:purine nucleoside phosphorylase LACC1 [Lethenteron reissneri]XP_061426196.1 purine nucleoside phosphorylase LACC1 [Lethenteron reissneri]XP_061426198.1 purine nucleoside phosphorylase LACC1 [Lethenteron reissneri]